MNPLIAASSRVRHGVAHFTALIATRWRNNFYIYLAAIFSLLIVIDATFLHVTANIGPVPGTGGGLSSGIR